MTARSYDSSNGNKYLYNGKELQDDLGLDWYDYGARFYDPSLGRFFSQDAFAEKYIDFSPYQYGANNPILFIDVNGDSLANPNKIVINNKKIVRNVRVLNQQVAKRTGLENSDFLIEITVDGEGKVTNELLDQIAKDLGFTYTKKDYEDGHIHIQLSQSDSENNLTTEDKNKPTNKELNKKLTKKELKESGKADRKAWKRFLENQ